MDFGGMTKWVYGYIQVSTRDQNTDRQMAALQELRIPAENIFMDKQSGKNFDRPQYKRLSSPYPAPSGRGLSHWLAQR